jgi:hypothetical protein
VYGRRGAKLTFRLRLLQCFQNIGHNFDRKRYRSILT